MQHNLILTCSHILGRDIRRMSRSIHITKKNFKGLTKSELDEQAEDPNSELRQWARKSLLKKEVTKKRKNKKSTD